MSNKFKPILYLCMFLIFLTGTYAVDLDYTFAKANSISLNRPCFYTVSPDGWCPSSTVCQMTVTAQNGSIVILGQNMTNLNSTHNLTIFNLSNGIYKTDVACSYNNLSGYDTFYFGVNNVGENYNETIAPFIILGILIILLIAFIVTTFIVEESLRLVFLFLSILMLPITLWYALDVARNSFMGSTAIAMLSVGYMISLTCLGGFVFYILWTLMMKWKIKKTMSIPKVQGSPAYWQKKQKYKDTHQGEEYS